MADPKPLYFKGESPEECEIFVATVRRRAFDQGKHRDNEWMAGFASTCFIGDAFYWYENLDEAAQNDWNQLRPALVARFGREASSASTSRYDSDLSLIYRHPPAPALRPPGNSVPVVRKGYLRVRYSNGRPVGYIAETATDQGLFENICETHDNALAVSFTTPSVNEVFEIQILDGAVELSRAQVTNAFALVWADSNRNHGLSGLTNSSVATCCSFSTTMSETSWPVERKVWTISQDGEVLAEYPKRGGSTERLRPFVPKWTNVVRWLRPSRPDTEGWESVKIVFEGNRDS